LNGYKFLHRVPVRQGHRHLTAKIQLPKPLAGETELNNINEGNATFLFMLIFLVKKYNVGTSLLYSQLILGRLKSALTSFNSWNHEVSIGNYFKYYNEIDHR